MARPTPASARRRSRLEACKILGQSRVPVRLLGELTEQERQEIELEENLRRKDLTPYEQARELVRKAPGVAGGLSSKIEDKGKQAANGGHVCLFASGCRFSYQAHRRKPRGARRTLSPDKRHFS